MSLGGWRRWSVPALAAAGIAAVYAAPAAFAGSPHPGLPVRSAAQLLAAMQQSRVQAFSGTISTGANLGLPQLPDRVAPAGSGLPALLTGTHTLRVWANGPDRQRLALLSDLAETDLVHNGTNLWTYTSATNTVTHRVLPPASGTPHAAGSDSGNTADPGDGSTVAQALTPQAQAQKALQAIDPTTAVSVDGTVRVAKRPAYQLTLTPRTSATLIRSVRIAIDATTFVPLRVQIFATTGTNPVWQTGFTHVDFTAPPAKTFQFTPPRGAKVTTSSAPLGPASGTETPSATAHLSSSPQPRVIGHGWSSILELPAGTLTQATSAPTGSRPDASSSSAMLLLRKLATPTAQGQLIATPLLSVLITPDGRVFVGAVPPAAVQHAASSAGA
ncbi:MAG TPA: hypothetical protein VGN54_00355 [Mycobacteriales bacterium]|jgi:outer membrane lipoprotein-sorting protein|nr:hypothetical protein [Mycobacteriales bacterium]